MRNIILSIKDKYAKKIINGKKLYEFRGWTWKDDVKYVYIFASGKTRKIVARFEVGLIDRNIPSKIWEKYKNGSGVSEKEFFGYVELFNYNKIFCIEIKKLRSLKEENYLSLDKISIEKAPQRFKYLTQEESDMLQRYFSE